MQGSRLTTYELVKDGFNVSLIADTMVGYMMGKGYVDKVITGADRITKDGYIFNKIGTYQLSVLAEKHGIPFYAAAPISSFDLSSNHDSIVIEKRNIAEMLKVGRRRIVPKGVNIINPAFDATPPQLISGIITNVGVVYPPLVKNIKKLIRPHL
jgi:methylthioribose-1-phosphate isomerase